MEQDNKTSKRRFLSRRNIIIGAGLGAAAIVVSKKPRDMSGGKDPYFESLQTALSDAGIGKPTLIVDKARLHKNIDLVASHLPKGMALRVAQKSVPSLKLLNEILSRAKTHRLMVFNKDYLQDMCLEEDYRHILLGKPLPVTAAVNFYDYLSSRTPNMETVDAIEWLIDSPDRLAEYMQLANARDLNFNINIELDVGMHRGGVLETAVLVDMLKTIQSDPRLNFAGFMGYEKHIVYAVGGAKAQEKAKIACWAAYQAAVDTAQSVLGEAFDRNTATLNGGGSATYRLYKDTKTMNDLCLGSAFVMPSHFDFDTLAVHSPASFISTPVLKQSDGLKLPGGGIINDIIMGWDPNQRQSFFHYGGRWLADPVYPKGLTYNGLYGRSSNQELVVGSKNIDLDVNDHIIFRPQESENVFLQFGDIAVFENGKITDFWPVMQTAP